MVPATLYDSIGQSYTSTRRSDPRIAAALAGALGAVGTIVNVGAGAGSYEPTNRRLIAVEPSRQMIRQRPTAASPVVQAVAEALPFDSNTFDAALAVLTLHHWADWRVGIAEMRRVAACVVVFAFDQSALYDFWLTHTYFPELIELDRKRSPSIAEIRGELPSCTVSPVPVPHDCADGFLAAFWRRPEVYLEPRIRAGMSGFALLDPRTVRRGVEQLDADLKSGAWDHRFGHLRSVDALDVGYRLLVMRGTD